MPSRSRKGPAHPTHMQGTPVTPTMAAAMEAMKGGALQRFRVGYGRDMRGPFYKFGTIEGLAARALVDFTPTGRRAYLTREGLAVLAGFRADQSTDQSNNSEAA